MVLWISLGPMSIGGFVIPFWISEHRVEGMNINSFACFRGCFDLWIQGVAHQVEPDRSTHRIANSQYCGWWFL